jgi:hypothetical protein
MRSVFNIMALVLAAYVKLAVLVGSTLTVITLSMPLIVWFSPTGIENAAVAIWSASLRSTFPWLSLLALGLAAILFLGNIAARDALEREGQKRLQRKMTEQVSGMAQRMHLLEASVVAMHEAVANHEESDKCIAS